MSSYRRDSKHSKHAPEQTPEDVTCSQALSGILRSVPGAWPKQGVQEITMRTAPAGQEPQGKQTLGSLAVPVGWVLGKPSHAGT